ncbi:hypothetical protein OAT16_06645 [Prolixibacteraceae bacterium]|uniref:hypothetical protein n=1 Tax=Halosquirtibacter xylanolyticus TaxID=3374599 RepID=UPI00374785BA|nr:hypothetical protein [Prolixibacteraceae bacterium]QZT36915.1 hypothetical protein K5X82_17015 [Prolixibacteraceae bacterium]
MSYQEQRICVWFENEQAPLTQITHATLLAEVMQKELCFYHISPNNTNHPSIEKEMEKQKALILDKDPIQRVTIDVSCGEYDKMLIEKIEALDLLLFIFDKQRDHKKLQSLGESAIPYLFTDEQVDIHTIFKDIIFPIGYMKRAKDSALWASYIARYNQTNVTILRANDSDEKDKKLIDAHLYSIENLFDKFKFPYEIEPFPHASWSLTSATYKRAQKSDHGLIIMALSLDNDFITKLIPGYYKKHIKKSKNRALLLINSKRDLYTMCGG